MTNARVFGTIPMDLFQWAERRIANGTYHNMSHVVKAGIMALREKDDSGEDESSAGRGSGAVVPPVRSGDDQEEDEGDQDDL